MKIAIVGSRGIPARYGGFETFAEEISTRLAEKGYEITVSCEYQPAKLRIDEYKGVKLDYFPYKPPKNYFLRKLYENLYDLYFLTKLSQNNDYVYFLGAEIAEFFFIPKLVNRSTKLVVNTDGAMWKRDKFSKVEKWLLELFYTNLAPIFADLIIVDAKGMKKFVKNKYHYKTFFIPYGIEIMPQFPFKKEKLNIIANYNKINFISKDRYWLVIARLEPENNIHIIIEAFCKANTEYPLIVVGDFTSDEYEEKMENFVSRSKHKIILLGSVYEREIVEMLRQNCFAYIHGHSTGGTNPSLLEIMISKTIILAHDNKYNQEVCGESTIYFKDVNDLINKIQLIEKEYNSFSKLKYTAYKRAKEVYNWEKIVDEYDKIFKYHKIDPKDANVNLKKIIQD